MPFRIMLEQVIAYQIQLKEIKNRNKHCKIRNNEYLSGIKASDRLLPVIILVAYWGDDEWRGPKSIYDKLGFN